ncbi:MAG: succinylglutamate desuccinylase/aspartoacylase family protein [Bacillota bacterium]|nr:succinylglutamate desuccinylase/aspartoacylase family protein [Bacillota bacterium]
MARDFAVGTASAAPGTKARGYVKVGTRPDGSQLAIPVVVINGAEDGPVLCVDAMVHGDEHEGMLALIELTRTIDPRELKGKFIGVPAVNVPAFEAMQRGNPQDVYIWDLNRNYPGRPDGFLTERIAYLHLNEIVSRADLSISFHCGANYFYLIEKVLYEGEDSLELAQSLGPAWDVLWTGATFGEGTLTGQCLKRGIPAVSVELGGASGRLPQNFLRNVGTMVAGVENVMRHYGMLTGEARYAPEWLVINETQVCAQNGGLLLPEPDFELKRMVKEGTTLLRIYDLFGEEVERITAPFDGLVMGLRTYPAVHTGDWTLFIGKVVDRLTQLRKGELKR